MFLKHITLFIKDPTIFADILSTYKLLPNEVRDQVSDSRGCTNHVLLTSQVIEAFISFITTNKPSPQESVQQLVMLLEKYKSVLLLGIGEILYSVKTISCTCKYLLLEGWRGFHSRLHSLMYQV